MNENKMDSGITIRDIRQTTGRKQRIAPVQAHRERGNLMTYSRTLRTQILYYYTMQQDGQPIS